MLWVEDANGRRVTLIVYMLRSILSLIYLQVEDLEDYIMDKRDNDTEGLRKEYEVTYF